MLRFCCALVVTLIMEIETGGEDSMNVMLIDSSAQALSRAAERLTSQQAPMTLFLSLIHISEPTRP